MAASSIPITAGSGTNVATRSFTEGAVTKHFQRFQLDSRRSDPPKRYQITLLLPGVAGAGTNLAGLRKLAANGDCHIIRISVKEYHAAVAAAVPPLVVRRATTVAGGTLIAAANVPKNDTTAANATLEVRTGAVTGTEAPERLVAFGGTPTLAAGGGSNSDIWDSNGDYARAIQLVGDEGLIFDQELAGDVDCRYFVTVEWEED